MDSNLDQSIKARLYDNYLEQVQVCDPLVEVCATLHQKDLSLLAAAYRRFGDDGVRAVVHAEAEYNLAPEAVTSDYLKALDWVWERMKP